jgi:hypothetical protein
MKPQPPTLTEAFQSAVETIASDNSIHSVHIVFQMGDDLMEAVVERSVMYDETPQIHNIKRAEGGERYALVSKAKKIMRRGLAACYSELYGHIEKDITTVAKNMKIPEAFVALHLVDDLEADLESEREAKENLGLSR